MKTKRFSIKCLSITAAILLISASSLAAATFTGQSNITFDINDHANPNATYHQFNERGIYLGRNPSPNYTIEDVTQSLYKYNRMDVDAGQTFELGEITHWNGRTVNNTTPDSVVYNVNIDLRSGNSSTFSFDVDYNAGKGRKGDIYSIPDSLTSNQTFDYMGKTYALELLGFGNNPDSVTLQFITGGRYTNTNSNVYGRFIEVPATVPTPAAATLGLAALALLTLRRNNALKPNLRTVKATKHA